MAPKKSKSQAPAKPRATYQVQQGYVVQPAQVLAPVVIACNSGGCPYGPAPGSDYCSNHTCKRQGCNRWRQTNVNSCQTCENSSFAVQVNNQWAKQGKKSWWSG